MNRLFYSLYFKLGNYFTGKGSEKLLKAGDKGSFDLSVSRRGITTNTSEEVSSLVYAVAPYEYEVTVCALLDEVDHIACFIVTGVLELEREFIEFGSYYAK